MALVCSHPDHDQHIADSAASARRSNGILLTPQGPLCATCFLIKAQVTAKAAEAGAGEVQR